MLACPVCAGALRASGEQEPFDSGALVCVGCGQRYPVVDGIPRFVAADNYAANFGLQWNRFRQTQLDSVTGLPISRRRFFDETGWTPDELRGRRVLDVGCGSGRFAEVALSCGADVVALDYSTAVDACSRNLAPHQRLEIVQGDLYAMPFIPGLFDYVYSLGVLQHTPDVRRALLALPRQLAGGGRLAVDFYLLNAAHWMHPRTWLRPVTRRLPPERLFTAVDAAAPALLRLSRTLGRAPLAGRLLKRLVPVANYEGIPGLSEQQLLEWAVLDTFDWLGARYEYPQRPTVVRRWLHEAGLDRIEVFRSYHLAARAVKPPAAAS
jgi:SAM-dependent methyltransferase